MLAEIFIIKRDDLLNQDYKGSNPMSFCEGIDAKGFETVILGTLQSILTSESFDNVLDQQKDFYTEAEQGPWIIALPENLINALSKSTEEKLDAAYKEWIQTEEFQMGPWDFDQLKKTYMDLIKLSNKAVDQEMSMYIWISL